MKEILALSRNLGWLITSQKTHNISQGPTLQISRFTDVNHHWLITEINIFKVLTFLNERIINEHDRETVEDETVSNTDNK